MTSLLLDALREQPMHDARLASASGADWASIVRFGRQHDVESLLYERLLSRGIAPLVPEPARAALAGARRISAARNIVLLHDAGRAVAALQARGIPVMVLKGVYLASDVYANAALRRMVDIDLMVGAGDLEAASETLQAEGYKPAVPIDTHVAAGYASHLPRFMKAEHAGIELHWRLGPPNPHCSVADLWERARPTRIGGTDTLTLSPEDTLLYLCGHASYQHQFEMGLRPFCDVAETIRRFSARLDWPLLVERARQWRWDRGAYLSLRLAREMVGAAVPDGVLLAIEPPAFDDAVIATARAIALRAPRENSSVSSGLASVVRAASLREKARVGLRRLFVAQSLIADQYALPRNSPRVPFYYLVRLKDLLIRDGRAALRFLRGDAALLAVADQRMAIEEWLGTTTSSTERELA